MSARDPGECSVCGGFGPWRRAGHAEWCDDIRVVLRSWRPGSYQRPEHGSVARYMIGCSCLRCVHAWLDYQRELELHDP